MCEHTSGFNRQDAGDVGGACNRDFACGKEKNGGWWVVDGECECFVCIPMCTLANISISSASVLYMNKFYFTREKRKKKVIKEDD